LILGPDGSLYGTTTLGGKETYAVGLGYGVVFKLALTSGVWSESVLQAFDGQDGEGPYDSVIIDSLGNLYGTTSLEAIIPAIRSRCGLVFVLRPTSGGGWEEAALVVFSGGDEGLGPYANLVMDPRGHLYGTTEYGGARGLGTVFELQ